MAEEAGDKENYNVGVVEVRRDHTHHSVEELQEKIKRFVRKVLNKLQGQRRVMM